MMRTQRQKQREMKSFILHRNALATEKSVAKLKKENGQLGSVTTQFDHHFSWVVSLTD